ncbi:PREDICTED: protein starmaker [Dufourea novaeangliae]|uniref:protein starmaker n=1 Tax=Dufourea novaeangliae TaxID=178035 RepID=UPI0007677893|nr:PREDICTED: protein starmaker [Dufourea novaeangliae]
MDSDSESQDSDDGRRFRFEATRKDNVRPEPKHGKHSRSKSDYKSDYDGVEYRDRKERSKHDSSRRERRSSKEQDTDDRDLRHASKCSKHESKSSKRECNKDGKDYKSARDTSIDSKTSALSSKHKVRDTKQHGNRDRSEHRKHRSRDRSRSRNDDDRSQNDKYRNKPHEKYKQRSRDRSRERSYQSHRQRSSDHGRSRTEFERHNSHKRASTKDADQRLQELSPPRNAEQKRSDNELLPTRDLSAESQGYKELDLSEFDVLSETDENLSDSSDVKNRCSPSRYHKTKTKKRHSNDEHENTRKKQATETEQSDSSPKVNARKDDTSYGSSNNNPGAISDSAFGVASPILTESIVDDCTSNVEKRSEPDATDKTIDLHSREETLLSSGDTTSLRLSNCDSSKPRKVSSSDEETTYGPVLPSQSTPDVSDNTKSAKSTNFIGPCLPEYYARTESESIEDDATGRNDENDSDVDRDMIFGPALPPHLADQKHSNGTDVKMIGPTVPSAIKLSDNEPIEQEDSENEDTVGPLPVDHPALRSSYVHRQLEHRAEQIKSEQKNEGDSTLNRREEWMTELPSAQISNLDLGPRKFRVRSGPDMSDRSCWTDTPAKKAEKQKQKEEEELYRCKNSVTESPEKNYEAEDEKSTRREKSLLEMHQSKLQKKKKKAEKKAKLTGQTLRRPFDRDIDLQINRFDQAQKSAIINKAQYLDERFSHGKI